MKHTITEVNKLPLWLACLIPVILGFVINRIARFLYEPYLPCCDPTYSGAQFIAASERACIWIMVGIIITDLFYTRKLHLTKWSGRVSYALMWLVYIYLLFNLVDIWTSMPAAYGYDGTSFQD